MKKLIVLTFITSFTTLYSQEANESPERPRTEITIGVSNLKEKADFNDFIYYDYYYDYYIPYNYNSSNIPSINIGLRQKIKNGAIRLQGFYGSTGQNYKPDANSTGSTDLKSNSMFSINTGGKLGYDFFKKFKIIEINYGFDLIMALNQMNSTRKYETSDYAYDPNTGQYLPITYEYKITEDYRTISYGLGLNLGIGLRLSKKFKVGIESQFTYLYGFSNGNYKNNNLNNYYSRKESGSNSSTNVAPLGLIYVAFGI